MVSVLLGPPILVRRSFQRWAEGKGIPLVEINATNRWGLIEAWLNTCLPGLNLVSVSLERLERKICLKKTEAQSKLTDLPPQQRRSFLEKAFQHRLESAADCLCFNILHHNLQFNSASELIEKSRSWFGHHLDQRRELVSAILNLYKHLPPAIWFEPRQPGNIDQMELAAEMLGEFALLFPQICIAWGMETECFLAYSKFGRDSRGKSVCNNPISVPLLDASAAIDKHDHDFESTLRYMAHKGATLDQAQELESLHDSLRRAKDFRGEEKARSKAETFLFDRLQSLPETAGLFVLNDRLNIPFYQGTMEVDLVNRKHKIAVEVDGYYHFCDPEAYRRDRRKDFLLQRHGFIIIRCLASEVVSDLENIFDRILDAISIRQGT